MSEADAQDDEVEALTRRLKSELLELAEAEGVEASSSMTKAALAAAIVAGRAAGAGSVEATPDGADENHGDDEAGITDGAADVDRTETELAEAAPDRVPTDAEVLHEQLEEAVKRRYPKRADGVAYEEREERENEDHDEFDHQYGDPRAHHDLFGIELGGIVDVLWRRDAHIIIGVAVITFAFSTWLLEINNQFLNFLTLAAALVLLVMSADFFLDGAKGLARRLGVAEIIIGLTIVSIGTSLPEILVTASASYAAGQTGDSSFTDLAVGNIFGSVLVQITLILGIVVLIKPLEVQASWLRRDGMLMLGAVILLSILVFWVGDGPKLTRWEGGFLCLIYLGYIGYLVKHRELIRQEEAEQLEATSHDLKGVDLDEEREYTAMAFFVMVAFGLALAVYASDAMVTSASQIAAKWGVSSAIIGVTVAAAGTSLPELAVGVQGAMKKSQGVAMGTLVGSNITDPLLSIGIAALIFPVAVSAGSIDIVQYIIMPFTIGAVALSLVFMASGLSFKRPEGAILVGVYVAFLIALVWGMNHYGSGVV